MHELGQVIVSKCKCMYCELQKWSVQVNLCQKLLFLHQLTHNMTTDFSLNHKFNTWKLQTQTWGEHVVYRNCFWHSEQFLYTTCSPHVLQKEELLTKIYLYFKTKKVGNNDFGILRVSLLFAIITSAPHKEFSIHHLGKNQLEPN